MRLLVLTMAMLGLSMAKEKSSFFDKVMAFEHKLVDKIKHIGDEHHEKHVEPEETDEKLAFVFEVVRHGARAPVEMRDIEEYPENVSEGILTPEGMRQRFLLGRYNRKRFIEDADFLSETFTPGEVYMQSTNVNRTIQSGYSELMGLYPPHKGGAERLTK